MAKAKLRDGEKQAEAADWIIDLAERLRPLTSNVMADHVEQLRTSVRAADAATLLRLFESLAIAPSGDGISAFSRKTEQQAARSIERVLLDLLPLMRLALDRLLTQLREGQVPAGYCSPLNLPKGSLLIDGGRVFVLWRVLPPDHLLRVAFPDADELPLNYDRDAVVCLGDDDTYGHARTLYRLTDVGTATAELLMRQRASATLVRKFGHATNADCLQRLEGVQT